MDAAARTSLADRFRWQAAACDHLGSPLYGELCRRSAEDIEAGGPLAELVEGHEGDPLLSMLQLRALGAVHRLALRGVAPALAACYPSTAGDAIAGDASPVAKHALRGRDASPESDAAAGALREPNAPFDATWAAFRETVADHLPLLRELIERPVQTNEVGRSRALACGFGTAAHATGLPLRLLELGASGGLNLRWDRFRYESGAFAFGDPASPVRFHDYHEGTGLPALPDGLEVASRRGCDEYPVDPSTADGRETLRAYVWADQRERFAALEGALELARAVEAPVDRSAALPWLIEQLAESTPGVCTVVFHSIVMQYVDAEQRAAIDVLFAEAGSRVTPDAPLARLARLAFEAAGAYAHMQLTIWPGGETRLLAECGYHGTPVRWLA